MYPNISGFPDDLENYASVKSVVDVIYNPLKTELVLQAERPLEVLREAWLEHQSVDEGEIFFSLLSGLREETQRMESPTMQMK